MKEKRLLATDLDGTFIGDDVASRRLWADLDEAGIIVVFATGRHLQSILDFCDRLETGRRPTACVAMVGTEVWLRTDSDFILDQQWADHLVHDWDLDVVTELVDAHVDAELQPAEWQSALKRSYFVAPGSTEAVERLAAAVAADDRISAKVVHSHDRFLDVLPRRSGKGEAVRFLAEHLGVAPSEVVTAGDTGNDLDMMRPELGFRSIIVGNATPELDSVQGNHVFRANRHFATGIEEGLAAFGWLARE